MMLISGVQVTACPLDHDTSHRHVVEVFSAGWDRRNFYEEAKYSPVICVEYLEPADGNFAITWLEMSRRLPEGLSKYPKIRQALKKIVKRFIKPWKNLSRL